MSTAADILAHIKQLPRKSMQNIAVVMRANDQHLASSVPMGKPPMARLFFFKDRSFLIIDFAKAPQRKVEFQVGEVRDGGDPRNPEDRRVLRIGDMTDPVQRRTHAQKEIVLAERYRARGKKH